jgi:putative aldouronate transport system permease protein
MKLNLGDGLFYVINKIIMVCIVVVTLYPFIHVACASVSDSLALMSHTGPLLKPLGFTLGAYKLVLKNPMITSGYVNTLFYVILGTMVNLVLTSLSAFVLSRRGILLKPFLMFMAVFTMFFSGGLIPFYLQVNRLGMNNTRWALIFPVAMSTYNLIIMRTSFMGIPASLEESAYMDGANEWTVLLRIILPLSKSILAVMALFYGVSHWNSWFNAMIFLRKRDLIPLQLVLREILITNDTNQTMVNTVSDREFISESVKYATIMVATVPVLFIYPFLQRYFVKGVMIGALKG